MPYLILIDCNDILVFQEGEAVGVLLFYGPQVCANDERAGKDGPDCIVDAVLAQRHAAAWRAALAVAADLEHVRVVPISRAAVAERGCLEHRVNVEDEAAVFLPFLLVKPSVPRVVVLHQKGVGQGSPLRHCPILWRRVHELPFGGLGAVAVCNGMRAQIQVDWPACFVERRAEGGPRSVPLGMWCQHQYSARQHKNWTAECGHPDRDGKCEVKGRGIRSHTYCSAELTGTVPQLLPTTPEQFSGGEPGISTPQKSNLR